jgi:hypothetical protein
LQISHPAKVLESEVPDLGTPAQEQGIEGEHCADVADANVCYVNASEKSKWFSGLIDIQTEGHN